MLAGEGWGGKTEFRSSGVAGVQERGQGSGFGVRGSRFGVRGLGFEATGAKNARFPTVVNKEHEGLKWI